MRTVVQAWPLKALLKKDPKFNKAIVEDAETLNENLQLVYLDFESFLMGPGKLETFNNEKGAFLTDSLLERYHQINGLIKKLIAEITPGATIARFLQRSPSDPSGTDGGTGSAHV